MSFPLQLCTVGFFLIVDSSRFLFDNFALGRPHIGRAGAQGLVFFQSIAGLISALVMTVVLEGPQGLKTLWSKETLLCMPVSVLFALSQGCFAVAFSRGMKAATGFALGFVYMPLSALLSRFVFRRTYGWVEMYALVILTFSTVTFASLRSRELSFQMSLGDAGWFVLLAVLFSCMASVLAEWLLKSKYQKSSSSRVRFCVQKARIDFWILVTNGILFYLIPDHDAVYELWDGPLTAALVVRVLQIWMAALMARHMSTVAKAVLQCVSFLLLFFVGDLFVFSRGDVQNPTLSMLGIVVALSALLFRLGRKRTAELRHAQLLREQRPSEAGTGDTSPLRPLPSVPERTEAAEASRPLGAEASRTPFSLPLNLNCANDATLPTFSRSISDPMFDRAAESRVTLTRRDSIGNMMWECYAQEAQTCAAVEFLESRELSPRPAARRCCPQRPRLGRAGLIDRAWFEQAVRFDRSLVEWASSWGGMLSQILLVAFFVLSDAGRTIIYGRSITGSSIVSQSIVVAISACSVVIGVVVAIVWEGWEGVKAALSWRECLVCMPVAMCFSIGQTSQMYAYGLGISAVENTVIGYLYMPLSAVLSRWIFRRAYSHLEWLALVVLVLSASVFVSMETGTKGSSSMDPLGVFFVVMSVVQSCLGSILAEKIMKAGQSPFHIQKVHLEIGGTITAVAMLFISGALSHRPNDAFWKPRDVGGGKMESGVFVGWDATIVIALVASLLQSWLGGVVAKRLSTVIRAVAQCMSLLLIYFVGDLILDGVRFDWNMVSMACVVALVVQVFALAGLRSDKGPVEVANGASEASNAAGGPATDGTGGTGA